MFFNEGNNNLIYKSMYKIKLIFIKGYYYSNWKSTEAIHQ